MKKLMILFLSLMPLLAANPLFAQEQESDRSRNVIKTNPIPILWGQIPLTGELRLVYERAVAEKQSLWVGMAYVMPSIILNLAQLTADSVDEGIRVGGVRVMGGYKFYLTEDPAPQGFYVGPFASYNKARFISKANSNEYVEAIYFNINAIIGYQLIVDDVFALEFFTGLGYKKNSWKYNDPDNIFEEDDDRLDRSGVKITLGANIGVSF